MRFETTARFDGDYRRLGKDEQRLFRAAVAAFIPAAESRVSEPDAPWPKRLRKERRRRTGDLGDDVVVRRA